MAHRLNKEILHIVMNRLLGIGKILKSRYEKNRSLRHFLIHPAYIDGAGKWQILVKVILPLAKTKLQNIRYPWD